MDLTTALLTAVGAESAAIVVIFWLYIKVRDDNDKAYQESSKQMIPLLEALKITMQETRDLMRRVVHKGTTP